MKEYLGEFAGTLLLVLIGCSAVAISVLFGTLNLLGVALVFGMGVAVAIYAVRSIAPAHLNPAVSVAMVQAKQLALTKLPFYVLAQILGAFVGASLLYLLFDQEIAKYEAFGGIVRGTEESYRSAMMFGEYFPNPGFEQDYKVSHLKAIFMEGLGTFFLVLSIFILSETKRIANRFIPFFIGLTVSVLICFIAPYTQGGFNPARDFSPRLVAFLGGWKSAAFPTINYSFFTVYIAAPIAGAVLATWAFTRLKKN